MCWVPPSTQFARCVTNGTRLKRALDVILGSVLALLALPVIAALALGCAISLRAWPFFVQRRVGKDGRHFPLPKLRTLPPAAPTAVDKYALDDVQIPPFCRLLRRAHVDELPQLLVVPLGWMSLVGPRPEMPELVARYPSDFAKTRTRVRPGCTGLWQVSKASGMLIYETPEYDLAYVDAVEVGSNRLDAWIIWRTLRLLSTGRGAIDFGDVPRWAGIHRGQTTTLVPLPDLDLTRDIEIVVTREELDLPALELSEGLTEIAD